MKYENIESVVSVVAGVLQFVVAAYALRLTRVYGATKVGWSLFCAFSLLALVHIVQFLVPSMGEELASAPMIEVMYALVAMLLLMGMVHMESLLKERQRIAQHEKEMRAELQSEVKKKTAYLTRAIEELQAEIDRRTAVEARMEENTAELFLVTEKMKVAETVNKLMDSMMKVLKSVNVSAGLVSDQVKESKIANVVRMGNLIRENASNLGAFMAKDPRGQKLPQYIAELAAHLANEQMVLKLELDTIKKNIEEIMMMQKDHSKETWEFKTVEAGVVG